jgi:hypothetical protein
MQWNAKSNPEIGRLTDGEAKTTTRATRVSSWGKPLPERTQAAAGNGRFQNTTASEGIDLIASNALPAGAISNAFVELSTKPATPNG